MKTSPAKEIEIISVDRYGIKDALTSDFVDLAVVSEKAYLSSGLEGDELMTKGMKHFKIGKEETLLLIPQGHPLFEKQEIYAADLDSVSIFLPADICTFWRRDAVPEYLAAAGNAQVHIIPGRFSNSTTYFAHDFGTSIGGISESQIERYGMDQRPDVHIRTIVDAPIVSNFYLVYKESFAKDPVGKMLIAHMKKRAPQR